MRLRLRRRTGTPGAPITKITDHGVATWAFYPALVVIAVALLATLAFPTQVGRWIAELQSTVVQGFSWYYVLVVAGFVVFVIWLGSSRFGEVRLGRQDEKPEYSLPTWLAMIFGAGMGIGLVFWGAAEPLTHLVAPRDGVTGDEAELARAAMVQSFLHWGVHAWAIYAVVGLALALALHRRGRPVSIRWALEPLLGDRVRGWPGAVIDSVALIGTVFGVATSVGLGAKQIAAGLVHIGVIDEVSSAVLVGIVAVVTAAAAASVVSGVSKGMKWLANVNIGLAVAFMIAVLAAGPTLLLLRGFVESVGGYVQSLPSMSLDLGAFRGDEAAEWQGAWTTFYWGWWISWAPFVGTFIAKISRGRTVREFVVGVLGVPVALAFLWFAVLGGSAVEQQRSGGELAGSPIVAENVVFDVVGALPMGTVFTVVAVVLVVAFSVTPAASSSLVASMLSAGGDPEPPRWTRILFAVVIGSVAITLLLASPDGAGLVALQTATIVVALPFSLVMLALCVSLRRSVRDYRLQGAVDEVKVTSS